LVKIVGIILIVLGLAALIFQGITYTKKEKVIDIGPIQATHEEKKTVPLSPILGVAALIGGVILLASGSRKST
jgi:uncharacterized membrane protein HdeD (DUF308 family)